MFQQPFSFDGRIRRTEYAISFAIYVIGYIAIITLGGYAQIFFIPLLWFYWAQGAKRSHDRSTSGWYQIIPFYFLVLLFGDSDYGNNEYGPNPKGVGNRNKYDDMIDEIGN